MIPTTKKGQTALEYLLIVVVAIIVVVAVMVYMNAASNANVSTATQNENLVLCASNSCTTIASCTNDRAGSPADAACGRFSAGACVGAVQIGTTNTSGTCQPTAAATYTSIGNNAWS